MSVARDVIQYSNDFTLRLGYQIALLLETWSGRPATAQYTIECYVLLARNPVGFRNKCNFLQMAATKKQLKAGRRYG
ncbi:hypothetical protein [Pseudomonas rossensis]|uniref:hypothetical protein n=1 Tax=Pseudomonas rossensis TaxID=2305471 RepID=UPI003261780A